MIRLLAISATAILLAGCASAPQSALSTSHPASADAPEGARIARQTSLRSDEATDKSNALLSAAKKEQKTWDEYGPVSGTPESAPQSDSKPAPKMEMNHEM
jgi:hypothetical protein